MARGQDLGQDHDPARDRCAVAQSRKMTMSGLITQLEREAAELIFPAFDEGTALALGQSLVTRALLAKLPVVINIRAANRVFFHAALPGSAPLNDHWAARKSATALMFQDASYLVGLRNLVRGETLATHGLDMTQYADHGGAVPIRVQDGGVVAVVTVSGLPQAEDHALVIAAIRDVLPPRH